MSVEVKHFRPFRVLNNDLIPSSDIAYPQCSVEVELPTGKVGRFQEEGATHEGAFFRAFRKAAGEHDPRLNDVKIVTRDSNIVSVNGTSTAILMLKFGDRKFPSTAAATTRFGAFREAVVRGFNHALNSK